MTTQLSAHDRSRLVGCRLTFASAGLLMGAWTTTLPRLRLQLGLGTAELGLLMLGFAAGGLIGLAGAPRVMRWAGQRRTQRGGAILLLLSAVSAGVAGAGGSIPAAAAAVTTFGLGFALVDVGMNLQGSRVEQVMQRSVLPGLNGMFSIGSVAGGFVGVAAVAWGVPVLPFLASASSLAAAGFLVAALSYDDQRTPRRRTVDAPAGPSALRELLDPRVIGLGVIVFVFCASEHAAFNWLIVAAHDVKGLSPARATAMLTVFSVSAVLARVVGGRLVDALGRGTVLRLSAALALAGTVTFVGGSGEWIVAGIVAWGFGASLGFPIAVSAAGEGDHRMADVRVSAVSSFGYGAQFVVPPAIGLVGQWIGLSEAILLGGFLLLLGFACARAARPPFMLLPSGPDAPVHEGRATVET
ncbi:hypothetical protein C6I20_14960 [Aeromicrobium sp. A1-2]|uniref:MFS transporter n=1 Tax=Aeromicrobium sp. A1-2 TaxID=2107713 RepID=UPI000E50AA8B|nr:MFS transporter [Aeromicrobium sp. A1-2]AXT86347.1 hypothetical protein C6I20_14960 [Aeromicrobium sp. A1-2]